MIDVRLPEEVLEGLPSTKEAMVQYLVPFVDQAIVDYELSLRRRVPGALGSSLARHEKAILRDFVLDRLMRNVLQEDTNSARFETLHEGPAR